MKNGNTPRNGLSMLKIVSKVIPINDINDLKKINDLVKAPSTIVAYLDYKVLIGKYSDTFFVNEQIDLESIQRIRIFNKKDELLLWRNDGKLKGRHRKDDDGDITAWVVENDQVLFGTKYLVDNSSMENYNTITEDRGTEITLPFEVKDLDDKNKQNRIKIKTRNYVDYNEIHQATFVDSRLVEFTFGKDNNPLEVVL